MTTRQALASRDLVRYLYGIGSGEHEGDTAETARLAKRVTEAALQDLYADLRERERVVASRHVG